jgi:hypothetical protein
MCPPMSTHAIQIAPMYLKLCNVYYPPTPSLGWIGQIKRRSISLASTRSASWLVYSLHPRSLTPICSWMHGCPPMPTQNPWACVGTGTGMGTQCRTLQCTKVCFVLNISMHKLWDFVIFFVDDPNHMGAECCCGGHFKNQHVLVRVLVCRWGVDFSTPYLVSLSPSSWHSY